MEKPKIIYVYDAICGWCFGFSPVMAKFAEEYGNKIDIEVISGGLMLGQRSGPIRIVGAHIPNAYPIVENRCGVQFGSKFLDQLREGKMVLNSLPPAIALCIMKDLHPEKALAFAGMLHDIYYKDGIDSEDIGAYGRCAANLGLDEVAFNNHMTEERYLEKAKEDFRKAGSLGVSSFPTVVLQYQGKTKVLFSGYLPYPEFATMVAQNTAAAIVEKDAPLPNAGCMIK